MPDLRMLEQVRSRAFIHDHSISAPTTLPDYPHIVEISSPIWVINQRNQDTPINIWESFWRTFAWPWLGFSDPSNGSA
jgi:hypothetical protein